MKFCPIVTALHLSLLAIVSAAPATARDRPATATAAAAPRQIAVYPLASCVVSGAPLGKDPIVCEIAGRTFHLADAQCREAAAKDPATFVTKLDAAVIAQQLPTYPLDTCPITGLRLGSMGAPARIVLDGTLVQLCCMGCVGKATANQAAIVARIRAEAFARQQKDYPLGACVVSGDPLAAAAEPVNLMLGTALVRVKDKRCADEVARQPATYLAKLLAQRPAVVAGAQAAAGGCGACAGKSMDAGCGGAGGSGGPCPDAGSGAGAKPKVEAKPQPSSPSPCGGCSDSAKGEPKAEPQPDAKPAGGCCGDKAAAKPAGGCETKAAPKPAGGCCGDKAAPTPADKPLPKQDK